MLYKVSINCFLDITDTATRDQIKNGVFALRDKFKRANIVETSRIEVHKCYHDETPSKPCEVIYTWEKI